MNAPSVATKPSNFRERALAASLKRRASPLPCESTPHFPERAPAASLKLLLRGARGRSLRHFRERALAASLKRGVRSSPQPCHGFPRARARGLIEAANAAPDRRTQTRYFRERALAASWRVCRRRGRRQ